MLACLPGGARLPPCLMSSPHQEPLCVEAALEPGLLCEGER